MAEIYGKCVKQCFHRGRLWEPGQLAVFKSKDAMNKNFEYHGDVAKVRAAKKKGQEERDAAVAEAEAERDKTMADLAKAREELQKAKKALAKVKSELEAVKKETADVESELKETKAKSAKKEPGKGDPSQMELK